MLVSTRGRYALRVMLDIAGQDRDAYIPLRDIAARQEISEKYLESILAILSRAGFVEGQRGKGGGYRLALPPERYTVGGILKLTEGSLAPVACLEHGRVNCARAASCPTLPMWQALDRQICDFLEGVTLADLLHRENGGDFVI